MENAAIRLPQVDKILREPLLEALATRVRREIITAVVREELNRRRQCNLFEDNSAEIIAACVKSRIEALLAGGIRRVINGTGVILSTNLGRAPLDHDSVERLAEALSSYCNLEFNLEDGARGERTADLSQLLTLLTGSQSAIVVNNCAAAVMLAVQALAPGKEVIVSRGELIEIGGSFRLPDVIKASGAVLKEVGTTNRTRLSDYKEAISSDTGLIIKCHRSNFQIVGFTEEVSAAELANLSNFDGSGKVQLVYDLGGGCLIDLGRFDLAVEPTVQETIASGVGLVLFSGDKLLGGPQAGIITGQKEYVDRLRNCPTYRTLRADKLILALLQGILSRYLLTGGAERLPVFVMAAQKANTIEARVNLFIGSTADKLSTLNLTPREMTSTIGGGSLPGEKLPSFGLAIECREDRDGGKLSEARLAKLLRNFEPPIIATVSAGQVMIDFRTLLPEDEEDLSAALQAIDQRPGQAQGQAQD